MPNLTSNFSFNKPLVNDPIDEDLWGGQLNSNWDSIDTILDALTPIGSRIGYTSTSAPNSRWLLGAGQAVSRTTYSAYFSLVGTNYGVGDGSTTFNMPDYRGRTAVGLDNLGGSSADRITDANADSLNNTGMGDEDITLTGTSDGHSLSISEMPSHNHTGTYYQSSAAAGTGVAYANTANPAATSSVPSQGGGAAHSHGVTLNSATGDNLSPSIAEAVIIRVL